MTNSLRLLAATAALALPVSAALAQSPQEWPRVGNDAGGMRYSSLAQINRDNVSRLKVAWVYHTGDAGQGNSTTLECTPIVAEGRMYVTTVRGTIVALDAATGRELWKFTPGRTRYKIANRVSGGVNRGVAYWSDGKKGGARRIIHGTADGQLLSLDAATGKLDTTFGAAGAVELRDGLEKPEVSDYGMTSAPSIYKNLVVLGFSVSEGARPGAPGDVRAFNVRSGKEVWRFHTVPRPGEPGHETWPENGWQDRSGVNAWGGITIDEKRGIVFAGLGSAAPDWYGADRVGDNLYANSTIALDAKTGKRIWHFQTLRHDMWDHDLPCPPVLVRIRQNGKIVDAAAQLTKAGYCYVFDRVTGKPIFGIIEKPAPPSTVPGERAAASQPIPVKPPGLTLQGVTENDITNISPEAHADALARFRKLRSEGVFTPGSLEGSLVAPAWHGGATWSGASFDPESGTLFVNMNNAPMVVKLTKNEERGDYGLTSSQPNVGRTVRFHNVFNFSDKDGYPGVKPPWGTLNAVDLNTGEIAWQVPLGEFPELTARGIPRTGTESFGGCIVTAGGLVFIGGSMDERFHAFDKETGKLLWETTLPAGGYATPSTYMVNGKQYVIIAAGGGGKLGTKSADTYVAFALP